jgi:hypothetical protein
VDDDDDAGFTSIFPLNHQGPSVCHIHLMSVEVTRDVLVFYFYTHTSPDDTFGYIGFIMEHREKERLCVYVVIGLLFCYRGKRCESLM